MSQDSQQPLGRPPRGQGRPPRDRAVPPLLIAVAAGAALILPLPAAFAIAAGAIVWRLARSRARGRLGTNHQAPSLRGRAALSSPSGAVLLGAERSGRPVVISDHALTAHTLVLGASGSGKSTTMLRLLSERIAQGAPVVAIDLKGSPSFTAGLAAAAGAAGRGFQVWTLDGPTNWNPLAHGNATELKDKLIATERFSEPHYKRAAERYVQLAVQVAQALPGAGPVTLRDVVDLLEPKQLAAAARRAPEGLGTHVRNYVGSLTPDQRSAVRGLGTRLAILTESHTGAFLGAGGIDLRDALGAGPADAPAHAGGAPDVVLFSLNSSRYGQLAAQVGTLAIQDIVAATGARLEQQRAGPSALVAIDEFSALEAGNVLALLARGREAGVGVILATQELADLDRAAHGLRDQVLGNTGVKIAHRQDVPTSAQTVASLAGTVQRWERSYQERPGRFPGSRVSGGASVRLTTDYAIEPETIRALPAGQAVVITKVPNATAQLARITPPAARSPRPGAQARPPAPGVTR